MRDSATGQWHRAAHYQHSYRHQFHHLGLMHLVQHLVFISDHALFGERGIDVDRAMDIITEIHMAAAGLPVLCLDSNVCDINPLITRLTAHFGCTGWFVIQPDARGHAHPCVDSWPSWLILQQIEHRPAPRLLRTHRISLLSGTPRYHRLALWQAIRDLVRSDDVVVINRFAEQMWCEHAVPSGEWQNCSDWLQHLPWSNNQRYIDNDQDQTAAHACGAVDHAAYQACVNITGETVADGDVVFVSEKTWKAYRAGCGVINFAHADLPGWLAMHGIQLLPQDAGVPWLEKIKTVQELFASDDVRGIYHDHQEQILHNQARVLDPKFAWSLAESAVTKIRNLLNM